MKKIIFIVAILMFGLGVSPTIGEAADAMAYSVKANIPENQINKASTYFDLKMEPNQKQEISLTISNSSDEEATIRVLPNVAMTNQNGVIDYSQAEAKHDSSLKNPISSIISKAQEVTLKPKETKDISFTLQMPEKEFDGLILGGFYISKKADANKAKDEEKDVQIKNEYSYVIGLQIRENTNEVKPVMELNEIQPTLLNYRTAVTANLQNTQATIINGLSVDAKVMKKGESTVLHETKKEELSMAPNSNFNFPVSWDNQSLDAGKYVMQVVAKAGDDEWEFEKEFEITAKESKSMNEEAVELEKSETNWLVIILSVVGGLLVLIIIVGYFIYRHNKKKAAAKRARLNKQRKRKKAQEMRKKQPMNSASRNEMKKG
ncbi:conserved exported hypothetical protein [Carnobacterium maltaromaticum]|uniref:DUF916 and DUF3324 domain-containing protein n=1 Tax=Carnobacterium maltaromaticum TaxID=2751 RepID=UPI00191BB39F|nr:DUF916 and DUF3324 domain-containing protein [Carnobacterium maltaromaticum]CAD5898849.1 conserved exported hypothetical protein [Carnobacterium maltaromaticum]